MGKAEDGATSQVLLSERLPLLCQQAAPSPTYLSQEEVVHQASTAPWPRLRSALLCLLAGLFACMLAMAVLLLVKMPSLRPALPWWQKAAFYQLPVTSFYDSNGDGRGDLEGVRHQVDQLPDLSIQALVLGPILEGGRDNLTRVCSSYGSLEQLQALVAHGHEKGIRILLELPAWEEGPDPATEDHNRTAQAFQGAMQFWQEQGVDGFLVAKDPAWRLDVVLNAWSELDQQTQRDHREARVLMIWDQSGTCNVSHWVSRQVIFACHLLGAEKNLTTQDLAQRVDGAVRHARGPWPSWTVPKGLPLVADLGQILGVLLFTLPGVPLLQGGEGSPLPLDKEMMENGSSSGVHPQANLYRSLLALRAKSFPLQGRAFAPLPLAGHCQEEAFAFLRPGSCSARLVILNLGSQPCLLDLRGRGFPSWAQVLFSTHPEPPQSDVDMERVRLAPRQAILLRVPGGYRQ